MRCAVSSGAGAGAGGDAGRVLMITSDGNIIIFIMQLYILFACPCASRMSNYLMQKNIQYTQLHIKLCKTQLVPVFIA